MRAILAFLLLVISAPASADWLLTFDLWVSGTATTYTYMADPPFYTVTTGPFSRFLNAEVFVPSAEGTWDVFNQCSPFETHCGFTGRVTYDGQSLSLDVLTYYNDDEHGCVPLTCTRPITVYNGTSFLSSLSSAQSLNEGPLPLPEPATWAMMLLGFGATGFTIRRHRKATRLLRAS
jgi:hypothetical protein